MKKRILPTRSALLKKELQTAALDAIISPQLKQQRLEKQKVIREKVDQSIEEARLELTAWEQTFSKTAKKQEAKDVKGLGIKMGLLQKSTWVKIVRMNVLPEDIYHCIEDYRSLLSVGNHGAIKRQEGFIGKMMRSLTSQQIQSIDDALQSLE